MLSSILQSPTSAALEQVLNFAQARHAILAGNVANLDTPGYRVRDLSVETFQERLEDLIETRRTSAPAGDGKLDVDDELRRVKDSMKSILFHDGSDVGIEQQVTEISKNQMMHNLAIAIMNSQYRLMEAAISERV